MNKTYNKEMKERRKKMKLKEMTNQELVNVLVQRAFNVANYPNSKSKSMELDRAVKEIMGRLGCAVEEKGK